MIQKLPSDTDQDVTNAGHAFFVPSVGDAWPLLTAPGSMFSSTKIPTASYK